MASLVMARSLNRGVWARASACRSDRSQTRPGFSGAKRGSGGVEGVPEIAVGGGEAGLVQADATHGFEQNIREGGKPHPQLTGRDRGRRRPIGKQLELLADAILGLATRAVEFLAKRFA
jgi:hypothetical protein